MPVTLGAHSIRRGTVCSMARLVTASRRPITPYEMQAAMWRVGDRHSYNKKPATETNDCSGHPLHPIRAKQTRHEVLGHAYGHSSCILSDEGKRKRRARTEEYTGDMTCTYAKGDRQGSWVDGVYASDVVFLVRLTATVFSRKPFLKRRETFLRYRMRPVPVVLRRLAF